MPLSNSANAELHWWLKHPKNANQLHWWLKHLKNVNQLHWWLKHLKNANQSLQCIPVDGAIQTDAS